MRARPLIWLLLCLLLLAGGILFWQLRNPSSVTKPNLPLVTTDPATRPHPAAAHSAVVSLANAPTFLSGQPASVAATKTNRFAYRLSNTPKLVGQLLRDDHAILLENALIDTRAALGFAIPQHLRAAAEPGSYIVQARGPVDDAFRAALTAAGGTIVSYIPNNAYLVRLSAQGASQLSAATLAQAVLPYEPIYKLKSDLLSLTMEQRPLPPDAKLNVMIFADLRAQVLQELQRNGDVVLGESPSAFIGPVLTIQPGENWTALAQLPGVAVMEQVYLRVAANDLSRVRVAVATDSVVTNNYLDLTGAGVLVSVNDTGVDPTHPDLTGRVIADSAASLVDDDGHGTFVAGIVAGSGAVSETVSNASGSINPGALGQYRGKASGARVFSQSLSLGSGPVADATLQETAALTNALISNNSWHYGSDNSYSIGAASYDAAVRDALPRRTGSQPVLFVFSAGNDGGGDDSGSGGESETILSPGTAKNVITVGALELARDITNAVVINCTSTNIGGTNVTVCETNYPWQAMTSSGNQVASFSSRGNVGIGTEGEFGRFKPDLVAPGTFVVSTRSATWDERAYYNPTGHLVTTFRAQVVAPNALNDHSLYLPANAVGFTLQLFPNQDSPLPFPDLPIFVRRADLPNPPTTYDFVRTNSVSVPPDGGGVGASVRQNWFYSIGNATTQDVSFSLVQDVIVTNELGNYLQVLSNLNNSISGTNPSAPQYYRYESGTSMSAADVSGTLALMQQFFEQGFGRTNSPAMMKALLINGARSAGSLYDFEVQNTKNFQGWGLPKLNNTLPSGITNAINNPTGESSMALFDQSPARALSTGQQQTRLLAVNEAGTNVPLRITLVWTDPPGNPVAGVKLVNDLDLVVTNLTTGEVFFGNDIPVSSTFTFPWETNTPPNLDYINNVENVYLAPALGANYSITVVGRRVNVNAVTAQTNNVVQDYALVISSGDGEVTNSLIVTEQPVTALNVPYVTAVTNSFAGNPSISGSILLDQHVGANTPLLGTTNGMTNQWHFYIVTNTTTFTNAAFITFLPPELAVPRMAVRSADAENGTLLEADIDLYVSTDPRLLLLDPAVVAAADQSRNRGGTEFVAYSNAPPGQVYYVGVKSEDQMAAEYAFFGGFSLDPFSSQDGNGNVLVNGFPLPNVIADGTPNHPGGALTLGLALQPLTVRSVIVTNSIYLQNQGDIVSTLSHARTFTVLSNHRVVAPGFHTYVYEDNDEQALQHPDGPGQLRDFVGESGLGVWLLTTVDNSGSQTGSVTGLKLFLAPTINSGSGDSFFTVQPDRFIFNVVDVPVGATNLTVCIGNLSLVPAPLELYVRRDDFPSRTTYDYFKVMNPTNDCLTITRSDIPPLQPGRYYIGVFNPSGTLQNIRMHITVGVEPSSVLPLVLNSAGDQPLRDDAVTDSIITVTNDARIQQVEVGLRIDHPRVSDLAVTLISPRGTRVLLAQNRGGTSTEGFGSTISVTNVIPVSTNGGPTAVTNVIDTGATAGFLTIDYDFFDVADQMTVYYQGALLLNSGMITGPGRFTVNYGPGASSLVTIIMNEFGNPSTNTLWNYTVSSINNNYSYLLFTENTNLTTTPIKFAPPPLTAAATGPAVNLSNFEPPQLPGNFVAPAIVNTWTVLTTNMVTVVTGGPPVTVGAQSLALRAGQLSNSVPTTPGRSYRLNYDYRSFGNLDGIVAWWPGENNVIDIVGANNGALQGGSGYAVGEVGQAFVFGGINGDVKVPASASLDVGLGNGFAIEGWINPFDISVPGPVVEWNSVNGNNSGIGVHLAITVAGPGSLYANIVDTATSGHFIQSPVGLVVANVFQHVALTYDKPSGLARLYLNGVVVAQQNLGTFTPATASDLYIGTRPSPPPVYWWKGIIDEMTIYNRALQATEIQAIYAAGAAGKCGMLAPPAVCGPALGAQIFVPGQVTNTIVGANNWKPGGLIFTASTNNTTIELTPLNPNQDSGILLDSFTLTEASGDRYVLAEESLNVLRGENAQGDWTLELWDSRTGATNLVSLVSWELQFIFQDAVALPELLIPAVASTNSVPPGQIAYYVVDVPAWAQFATNTLVFASGPLNVMFNQFTPPQDALLPSRMLIGPGATSGSATLSTLGVPPLLPGLRYYLGVSNPGPATVTYALQVDFDLTALTNGVPVTSTLAAGPGPRYFYYDVTPSATAVSFELLGLSGDANLVARRGAPLPTLTSYDYGSFNSGTLPEAIIVFTNSAPVALSPGRWYLGVYNADPVPGTYSIVATELTNQFPNIITLTNGIAYANTNSSAGNATDYYRYVVTPSAVRAQFEINGPSDNVTLVASKGLPLPSLTTYDYLSANVLTNDELIVVLTNSAPVALTPGDWFLSAVNLAGVPVTYSIKATEWNASEVTNLVIISYSVVSNQLCFTWTSIPGVHYFVEGKPDLSVTNWTTLSPTLTAVDFTTTWCLPLPSPFHFFRVSEGLALSTFVTPPVIRTITVTPGGVLLGWNGPLTATYNVQWTPTLVPPAWTSFTNIVTSATGQFQFLDDGSQTGGLGSPRYYRLLLLP